MTGFLLNAACCIFTYMNRPIVLHDATPARLQQAAALNHTELFRLTAIAENGSVHQEAGVTWTNTGMGSNAMIAFPQLPDDTADAQLDAIINSYLQQPPQSVGCWSLAPTQPADLDIRLLARGFQTGWKPCWMALDLEDIQAGHPFPPALQVTADNSSSLRHMKTLPYASTDFTVIQTVLPPGEQYRLQRFVAVLNGRVVAHSGVLLTTGDYGAAGIYHVGVLPGMRNQGIGKAVVLAACRYAKEQGYRYAVLNATGRRMYEQVGFQWVGDGFTWWLNMPRLLQSPPSAQQVQFAEAIGRGNTAVLQQYSQQPDKINILQPLNNGMTLMELAVHCQQPASAEWLLQQGHTIQVLEAWDLGWKGKAAELLATDPAQANHRYGEWERTLLHIAAERNDTALAKLVLSAQPDITLKDNVHQSTALGWAAYFGHNDIISLINDHTATQ